VDANLRHPHVCKSVASNCLSGLLDLGHWQTHADDDDDDDMYLGHWQTHADDDDDDDDDMYLGHWQTHADDDDDDDDMRIIRGVYACKARLVDTQVTAATGHAVNW